MNDGIVAQKSYDFAIRIVKLYKYLSKEYNEYVLSKQVLRSGTAIGALIREAKFAQSKADFISKMSIALKEANETHYWIDLLYDTEYINNNMYLDIEKDINEIISLLVSIVKSSKNNS
jgi:four helix bundle protein